jgi:cell fate (sporulation/competence/biofilm development) regulator YlbF (YheA/YmcA/DUF963 family)
MTLSSEVGQAAEALGRLLRGTEAVRTYLEAQGHLQEDAEVRALDSRVDALHKNLLARKQAGEKVGREEMDAFYALRSQAQGHPLIADRDLARLELTRYLADLVLDLGIESGADYRKLALGE